MVTPLVSLMEDQVSRARLAGLRAEHFSATQAKETRRTTAQRVRDGGVDLLFVSPERLDVPTFNDLLSDVDVRLLAVDEAHCISEWGHDFRPAYRRIGRFRAALRCPTLALTASATPAVRADILDNLELSDPLIVVRSFDRPNLWWAVVPGASAAERSKGVYRAIRSTPGCAIVYAPTRRWVETVRDDLARRGIRAEAYHAGLPGPERSRVQAAFMTGACRVVVATNAFGMGIDKADVRTVVHVQLPATLESYYQEAGRAGRDGESALCLAFHGRRDRLLVDRFIARTHPKSVELWRLHRSLRRHADRFGVARVDDPGIVRVLGGRPTEWLMGESEGPLGALERAGGIRRLGTEGDSAGSCSCLVGVSARVDFGSSARGRRRVRGKLGAVLRFARAKGCRRQALLRYFGEVAPRSCGRCDQCGYDLGAGFPPFDR